MQAVLGSRAFKSDSRTEPHHLFALYRASGHIPSLYDKPLCATVPESGSLFKIPIAELPPTAASSGLKQFSSLQPTRVRISPIISFECGKKEFTVSKLKPNSRLLSRSRMTSADTAT